MSKTNRFSIHVRETERAKLRALKEDYQHMIRDRSYKQRVIDEARAREAMWDTVKDECRPLRAKQGRLF